MRESIRTRSGDHDKSHYRLMVRVSWLHYVQGLTQAKVAEQMKLSRARVNRLVQAARDAGIVKFSITVDEALYPEMEQELCDNYDLLDAVVVPYAEDQDSRNMFIAQGAADWLKPRLRPDLVIGLGTGRTIAHLPSVLKLDQKIPCTFCDMTGTVIDDEGLEKYTITSRMAEITGGNAARVFAPVSVTNSEVRRALLEERSIADALRRAERSDIVILGVGGIDQTNGLVEHGYLSLSQLQELQSRGAAGETMGLFFNEKGQEIPGPLDEHMISLTIGSLLKIPWRVCLAGGNEKVEAISAALSGKIFNLLVTDYQTAQKLTQ